MEESELYFGGLPTEPDIKKIREFYPDQSLKVGDVIAYNDIAEILGVPYGSSRFKTVTDRWRKVFEKDSGKVLDCEKGVGFRVNHDSQNLDLSGKKLRTATRMARRSYIVAGRIDRKNLSDDERKRLDFQARCSAQVLAASQIKRTAEVPSLL